MLINQTLTNLDKPWQTLTNFAERKSVIFLQLTYHRAHLLLIPKISMGPIKTATIIPTHKESSDTRDSLHFCSGKFKVPPGRRLRTVNVPDCVPRGTPQTLNINAMFCNDLHKPGDRSTSGLRYFCVVSRLYLPTIGTVVMLATINTRGL